jgi:hypothetical protein
LVPRAGGKIAHTYTAHAELAAHARQPTPRPHALSYTLSPVLTTKSGLKQALTCAIMRAAVAWLGLP